MSAPAWIFAAFFALTLGLFVIVRAELDRLYAEVRRLRADNDRQARLIARLQSTPDAQVLPFGPVRRGVVGRIPAQRNGEGA